MRGLAAIAVFFFGSCGDDDGATTVADAGSDSGSVQVDSGTEETDSGQADGTLITAAEGGTVQLGEATLTIPAGALLQDTRITVDELEKSEFPEAEQLAGPVYDFGPDGLTFSSPATIRLEFATTIPSETDVELVTFDHESEEWLVIEGSTFEGNVLEGPVAHFSHIAGRTRAATTGATTHVALEVRGLGRITTSPAGIDCENANIDNVTNCEFDFLTSVGSVTFTATPASGTAAPYWTYGSCNGMTSCTLSLASPINLVVSF